MQALQLWQKNTARCIQEERGGEIAFSLWSIENMKLIEFTKLYRISEINLN